MFDQFKNIVRDGERYIVVEGGEPRFVVMSFSDYRDLIGRSHPEARSNPASAPAPEWERANAELAVETLGPPAERTAAPHGPAQVIVDPSTVRLEDLPL